MSQKKTKFIAVIFLIIFIALAASQYFFKQDQANVDTNINVADSVSSDAVSAAALKDNSVNASDIVNASASSSSSIDLARGKQERVLGNPDAPIKISEHSSFSCGHCAKFHASTFKDFKANWLDTGKAYLVFSDFPLNAPALHASLVGRCIADDDQYFAYVEDVFANQKDWAFQADYAEPLKKIAAKYGIDGDMFTSCVQNLELQEALLNRVRATQQQFGINSTPSFVVNNAITISGGASYAEFNKTIEDAVQDSLSPGKAE